MIVNPKLPEGFSSTPGIVENILKSNVNRHIAAAAAGDGSTPFEKNKKMTKYDVQRIQKIERKKRGNQTASY